MIGDRRIAEDRVARPAVRHDMMDIFNYFEDIPEKAQAQQLPWNWRKWSEYRASLQKNVKIPVNFASYCGHIPLRLTVMGLDAWKRTATPAEIQEMCELLEDALSAGVREHGLPEVRPRHVVGLECHPHDRVGVARGDPAAQQAGLAGAARGGQHDEAWLVPVEDGVQAGACEQDGSRHDVPFSRNPPLLG